MASRKDQKEALRRERQQRDEQARKSAARKRLVGIVVAAILVLGIVGALAAVLLAGDDDGGGNGGGGGDGASVSYPDAGEIPDQQEADLDKAVEASGCKHETITVTGGANNHTEEAVEYESEPPAIGPHFPTWPEDDIYEESPPITQVVHQLEHGRILVWIKPDASEELLAQLKALYDEDPYHVIMLPRKELKEAVAVSAWVGEDKGHILRCATPNDQMWDAIRAFKEKYRDKAPEFVP